MALETVYLDPAYPVFYENRLFNEHDQTLNRDNTLMPFIRAKKYFKTQGIDMNTADLMNQLTDSNIDNYYYSFGCIRNYSEFKKENKVKLKAIMILEPPVVAPQLYSRLPELTKLFERVYVHNVNGDGFSLKGVDRKKLKKLYWPQPFEGVIEKYWKNQDRLERVVVINGNHKPKNKKSELYSARIKDMVALWEEAQCVDLFGRNWDHWFSRNSLWIVYYKNYLKLMKIYKGSCESKYSILSKYDFCLCYENMLMNGYITEKIFDCFYSGTIPIYWGCRDIEKYIPKNCYISRKKFSNIREVWEVVKKLTKEEKNLYRENAKDFMLNGGLRWVHSIENLIDIDVQSVLR